MSILLDVSLFFRNSKSKLNLSLANQAVLVNLASRVGSNSTTWVSHEVLAIDCGIAQKNLTQHTKALSKSGLIKVTKQKNDKRRNLYSFADCLSNYYQKSDLEKEIIHQKFGDSFREDYKNTLRNRNLVSEDTLRKRNLYTLRNRNLSPIDETPTYLEPQGFPAIESFAKGKGESNNKEKGTAKAAPKSPPFFEISPQEKQEAIDRNIDIDECYKKFKEYHPTGDRSKWEQWFKQTHDGKKSVNKHLEKNNSEHQSRKAKEMSSTRNTEEGCPKCKWAMAYCRCAYKIDKKAASLKIKDIMAKCNLRV